jgi:hypothetical protein
MNVRIVDGYMLTDSAHPEPHCVECRQRLQIGEVVVTFSQGPKVFVHQQLFVHSRHFAKVLDGAPTDEDVIDAEAAEVVRAYRATGRTVVDVLLDA